MTPREANQNSHSQPLLSKGQPSTPRMSGPRHFYERRFVSNSSNARFAAITRALICSAQVCNRARAAVQISSFELLCSVEVASCVNQNRPGRVGPARTSEQLFSRRGKNFRSSVAPYGRSGLTSRLPRSPGALNARSAMPFFSAKASASRTPAQPLRSMPRSSGDAA